MACFHDRCGERVTLLSENRTALRDYSEFNHGLVISAEPLVNDVLFEVKIDQKMNSWSGSVEIGVTECDPATLEFPACASKLQNGSWVMSGNSILMNGNSIVEFYGVDLEKLNEEDRVGVMRTSEADLVFFINGEPQGVAARELPPVLFAVVDLYGKCVRVSITHPLEREHNNDECLSCDSGESECELWTNSLLDDFRCRLGSRQSSAVAHRASGDQRDVMVIVHNNNNNNSVPAMPRDRLRFHTRCGTLVKLTGNQRTAERRRPLDEFNNGVVMTHRALRNDELFEIRLDRLVDKWSGSIEMGITTHNPSSLEFPATMTNMRSGTIMMSGCGILTNGKGTRREYGEFNLDELREGDRVGMMRRSNGNLHYFINGLDQGIAASKVPENVWGVIDLYGMTIKVTIVDRDEREEQNLITRRNTLLQDQHMVIGEQMLLDSDYCDRLMFHTNCGTHADVINNGRTAHRPNAADDFNNGVVLTSRPLKPGELFEVRLDKIVTKWAGSIEIGVTTHSPTELEFPFTMTNVRSGTWMMTGNGVMHNGTTILDQYGQNLDRLQVSDRVGVVRKESGTLHFYVNGNDQGPAASNVPEKVFGVIDLYGQAAQVTIQDTSDCYSPDTVNSSLSNTTLYSDLRFHHVHGKNARISSNGQTALRPHAFGEFNDAIVFSNRPLRDGEVFEVTLDHMVDRWSGSIELGVTAVKPDDVDLPSTATDLDRDTWMLSGCSVMENGITIKNGYKCDLDVLTAGTRIGVMRTADGCLHFTLNGESQGVACSVPSSSVYAVVDLYGQCAQVSLTSATATSTSNAAAANGYQCGSPLSGALPASASVGAGARAQQPGIVGGYARSEDTVSELQVASVVQKGDHIHRFSECHGKSIILTEGNRVASRGRDLQQCLVFSASSLVPGELFEVSLATLALQYAGSIKIGVTSFVPGELPKSAPYNMNNVPGECWYITGNEVRERNKVLRHNFCPSLEWLRPGDRIGLKRTHDGGLRILINSEDMGIAAHNLPETVYAVVELFGTCTSIRVTSVRQIHQVSPTLASVRMQDSLEQVLEPLAPDETRTDNVVIAEEECKDETEAPATVTSYEFHENHGRNIELSPDKKVARRVASYNQGIVITSKPVVRGKIIEIKIGQLDSRWTSSLICGIVAYSPERLNYPVTALGLKRSCCIVASDWISLNGNKVKSNRGQKLDTLITGSKVGLMLTEQNHLQIFVNGTALESVTCDLPSGPCFAVFDLYGQCQQITLLTAHSPLDSLDPLPQIPSTSVDHDSQQCEKADLESREKESSLCSITDNNNLNNLTLDLNRNNSETGRNQLENPTVNLITTPICTAESNVNKQCEYLKKCVKVVKNLVLPEAFFMNDDTICYCSSCYQITVQNGDIYKGMSPDYNPPKGWVKFSLRNFSNTQTDKWHVAFYGTKLCVIRAILDRGQPLTNDQLASCNLSPQPCSKEESQSAQIVFYPSIELATLSTGQHLMQRPKEKAQTEVFAAFQLLVRPGSYSAQQTQGQAGALEWSTKESGAIVLDALMLRVLEEASC